MRQQIVQRLVPQPQLFEVHFDPPRRLPTRPPTTSLGGGDIEVLQPLGLQQTDQRIQMGAQPIAAVEVSDDALLDILAVAEGLDPAKVVVAAGLDRAEEQSGGIYVTLLCYHR